MREADGGQNGSGLEEQLRVVIVDSPDLAAPLIGALDVADVGAWIWVEAERSLYFSPRVLDLLGLEAEPRPTLVERFYDCVHMDDQEAVRALLGGKMPAGSFRLRYRFIPAGGPLRWIEDRGRVERDDAGVLVRQAGAMRDVTAEVGRELEQRETDARLEALVNAMPFGVWGRSGQALTVTHQNAESIAMWGDMRGRALGDAPPHLRTLWQRQIADVMTGQIMRARRELVRDGEIRSLDEIAAPVIVDDRIAGVVGVTIDVTEEARAAAFQSLLTEISADLAGRSTDTLHAGLVTALEKIGRFLGAPLAVLCEMTPPGQQPYLRVTHFWVDAATGLEQPPLLEVDVSEIAALLQRVERNSAIVVRSREELSEESGERVWFAEHGVQSFAVVPARLLDGTRALLGLSATDDQVVDWPADTVPCLRLAAAVLGAVLARSRADADQKMIERRMQDAQKLESLGVLAGGIAHDFNNLLTAILGNASLLRAELDDLAYTTDTIEQIEAASRRAAELCRQMLAYAGRGRFALQAVDLNATVRDMQALLEVTVPKKARLELALMPSLPAVLADETQIRQLVMNLVLNAAEALDEKAGTIALSTSVGYRTTQELLQTVFGPQLSDGHYVSLSVHDTGSGMSPETVARIFDPFFSTKFTGRGLGLAAVVGIVRAHKGALRVVSEAGVGSTFELLLPVHEGVAAEQAGTHLANDIRDDEWQATGTALVVDDEAGVRDLVRAVLQRAGMKVVVAEDGASGVTAFEQLGDEVCLVILDLTMPGLDGREALAEMRRSRPAVPTILMSGYSPGDLMQSPSHVFLQKPFTPATLRAAAKRALA